MKVLWLSHMLPYPPTGGSLLRTYHLLTSLAGRHEVDLLAFVNPALTPNLEAQETAIRQLGRFCRVIGVHRLPCDRPMKKMVLAARCLVARKSYTTHWTQTAAYRDHVARLLKRSYDAILLDTVGLARNLPEGKSLPPILLNHHNEEVSTLERRASRARSMALGAYYRFESRRLQDECLRFFPTVTKHLVTSELDADRLRGVYPAADVDVIPNGVDTNEYPNIYGRERSERFTVLFIGGAAYPNQDAIEWLLDEIWPGVRAVVDDPRLVLIGRSPSRRSLKAAANDKGVVVTGYVEDIRPWAGQAGAFVCPMRDGGGTKLKVLHAFSLAIPVVSTRIGMEGIHAESETHYLVAESASEFVAQLRRVAESPELGLRLSNACRRLVAEDYDWRKVGAAFVEGIERGATPREPRERLRRSNETTTT